MWGPNQSGDLPDLFARMKYSVKHPGYLRGPRTFLGSLVKVAFDIDTYENQFNLKEATSTFLQRSCGAKGCGCDEFSSAEAQIYIDLHFAAGFIFWKAVGLTHSNAYFFPKLCCFPPEIS